MCIFCVLSCISKIIVVFSKKNVYYLYFHCVFLCILNGVCIFRFHFHEYFLVGFNVYFQILLCIFSKQFVFHAFFFRLVAEPIFRLKIRYGFHMEGISKIIANMQKARYLRKMTENESHIVFFVEKIEKTAMFHTFHRLFVEF